MCIRDRAQSWPRGGPETIGPSDGWLRKRFSDSGGFDRLDRRDQKLVGFIVRECLCYQLGAYYRREITREQLHQEAQRMMELLRYGAVSYTHLSRNRSSPSRLMTLSLCCLM